MYRKKVIVQSKNLKLLLIHVVTDSIRIQEKLLASPLFSL